MSAILKALVEKIEAEFKIMTIEELAKKYNLTEFQILKILDKYDIKK